MIEVRWNTTNVYKIKFRLYEYFPLFAQLTTVLYGEKNHCKSEPSCSSNVSLEEIKVFLGLTSDPKHMSEMFLIRIDVAFFDLTVPASMSANPACIRSTMEPMARRKKWSKLARRAERSWGTTRDFQHYFVQSKVCGHHFYLTNLLRVLHFGAYIA